jgi:hypothetical protein
MFKRDNYVLKTPILQFSSGHTITQTGHNYTTNETKAFTK